ncbi:hypothetical protein OIDMADRAFT_139191 [Oidiodendron maius Zn]|uniref:GST N-terminal domain-containing protein n=1 Tax=Oidiodendron maius (strain Zn) TaxID=913774 RepID=A0A0C3C1J3_OIDMZ|nr:hypothetical protein OIDMADRAFT_139191 [Oidiodendron maius Zn]
MGSNTEATKITLYTSVNSPWAHGAQIALRELGLKFEIVIVDVSKPRTPEYLAINPRGLVPSMDYNGTILTESGLISQFLVDTHSSHLLKSSSEPGGALQRFRIGFFVDTFFSKVATLFFGLLHGPEEETETEGQKLAETIVKELEPLLADAGPFFGGSERLTLAEVQTGGFILRILSYPKYDGLLPKSVLTILETKAPNFLKWANKVASEKSVTYIWDERVAAESVTAKMKARRAAAK